MRLIYSCLLCGLSPLLLVYTLLQRYKRGGDLRFIAQRMGIYMGKKPRQYDAAWFHAASVGETKAVIPLVMAVAKANPALRIVVSTNTCEAASLIAKSLPPSVNHYYFTTDFPLAVQRLVSLISPKALIVVETEIWPNLYSCCYSRSIPIVIVNARLSRKSSSSNRYVRGLYREILSKVSIIAARNECDAQSYINLGAQEHKVQVVGNIKLAAALSVRERPHEVVASRRYILFVSTHDGEEVAIGRLRKKMDFSVPFIIVPRHPQRRVSIIRSLEAMGLSVSVRSKHEQLRPDTDIYLADTLGEVNGFLANALMVFVGGSLVPIGGHNVLEPAFYGKPILVGPHIGSVQSEVDLLSSCGALTVCDNERLLFSAVQELLRQPEKMDTMGGNAVRAIAECESILNRYRDICLDALSGRLEP